MFNSKLICRTVAFITIVLAQAFMFGAAAFYFYFTIKHTLILGLISWEQLTWILVVVGVFLSFVAIRMIKSLIYLAEKETEAELATAKLQNSRELIDALRAQRHDAINHLQVIYGLIQLDKIDHVEEYIKQISNQ